MDYKKYFDEIKSSTVNIFNNIKTKASESLENALNEGKDIKEAVNGAFGELRKNMDERLEKTFEKSGKRIDELEDVYDRAKVRMNEYVEKAKKEGKDYKTIAKDSVEAVKEDLKESFDRISEKMSKKDEDEKAN